MAPKRFVKDSAGLWGRVVAGLAIAGIVATSWSDEGDGKAALRFRVELTDGSRIVGVPSVAAVPVKTVFGDITVPFADMKTLSFQDGGAAVVATLVNEDRISGVHGLDGLRLATSFGEVLIPLKTVTRIVSIRSPEGSTVSVAIKEALQRKARFSVTFDRLSEPLGSIRPGAVLFGVYTPESEAWEVWSSSHPSRPGAHFIYAYPKGADGNLPKPVRPSDNAINLWGVTMHFDEAGRVYHHSNDSQTIGSLAIDTD